MKIASAVSRYLLGLMFTVMGLDGFIHFIHRPTPTNPLEVQFFIASFGSHFAQYFFAPQLIGGLLLLSGYFVPLGLTLLAAELYNILAFHLSFERAAILPAFICCVAWVLIFLQYRKSFNGIFKAKPATQA
jgi:putative oxidoreductase